MNCIICITGNKQCVLEWRMINDCPFCIIPTEESNHFKLDKDIVMI